MTLQMITLMGEYRPEDDGTVTVRFTISGMRPDQAERIGDLQADALRVILGEFSKDGGVEMFKAPEGKLS